MRCAQGDGGGSTRLEPDGGEARGPCVGFDRKFFASSHTLYRTQLRHKIKRPHTFTRSSLCPRRLQTAIRSERRNSTHTAAAPHQNISREPAGLPGHAARIAFHLISDLPRRLEVCKLHLERHRRHTLRKLARAILQRQIGPREQQGLRDVRALEEGGHV